MKNELIPNPSLVLEKGTAPSNSNTPSLSLERRQGGEFTYRDPREMKDSGVEWIGLIPKGWYLKKISWLFSLIGSGTTPSTDNLSYYEGGTINWLLTGDLNDNFILETSKKITYKAIREISTLKIYPINTLVIAMYGATIGKLGITSIETSTNQACGCFANPKNNEIKYIFYWFLGNRKHIIEMGYGGGQPNISQNLLKNLRISIPLPHEQATIANFLDRKTAEFDNIIAKKEKIITKLEEAKKSLISELVTGKSELIPNPSLVLEKGTAPSDSNSPSLSLERGLGGEFIQPRNPSEMKDSGVEWIGMIPKEWEVTKLKFVSFINMGQSPDSETINDTGLGLPFFQGKTEFGKLNPIVRKYCDSPKKIAKENEILISVRAPVGDLNISDTLCCIGRGLASIKAKEHTKFLYYLLLESKKELNSFSTGSTFEAITVSQLADLIFTLPPLSEQKAIANFLDRKTAEFDKLIEKEKKIIEKIKEAKQSLISEAVTGKIKVL